MSRNSQHTRFEDNILGQVSFGGFPAACASLLLGEIFNKKGEILVQAFVLSETVSEFALFMALFPVSATELGSRNFRSCFAQLGLFLVNWGSSICARYLSVGW